MWNSAHQQKFNKKIRFVLVSLALLLGGMPGSVYAAPVEIWTKLCNAVPGSVCAGGTDLAVHNASGSVYVTGTRSINATSSSPSHSYFATGKYNADGSLAWEQRYGPVSFPELNQVRGIAVDFAGNAIVTGTSSTGPSTIIKYDANTGNILWISHGNSGGISEPVLDAAGNVYVTDSFATTKYNTSNGIAAWTIIHGDLSVSTIPPQDRLIPPGQQLSMSLWENSIAVDVDGNVYVTGVADAYTSMAKTYTVKYDVNHMLVWEGLYSGMGYAADIAVDAAGSVYVTGISPAGTSDSAVTIKYDSNGALQWNKFYPDPSVDSGHTWAGADALAVDAAGNVYVTGSGGNSVSGARELVTIKYDAYGTQQWFDSFAATNYPSIALDAQGNAYVTGGDGSATVRKYDALYNPASFGFFCDATGCHLGPLGPPNKTLWVALCGGTDSFPCIEPAAIAVDAKGYIYATGAASGTSTGVGTFKYADSSTPPELVVSNLTVPATSTSGAIVTFTAIATDNIDGLLPVTCDWVSGDTFPIGVTLVTCISAPDSDGRDAVKDFTVTVIDEAPLLGFERGSELRVEATGPAGAIVTFPAVTDAVDGTLLATCEDIHGSGRNVDSGSIFPIRRTGVRCWVTDSANNIADSWFVVHVFDAPPVINAINNLNVEATSSDGAIVAYTATATDTVDGPVPVYCDWPSGSTFPVSTWRVNCSATDSAGNTVSSSFTVTVVDAAPVLSALGNLNVSATSSDGAIVAYTATATDTVDGPVPVYCDWPSGVTFPIGITTVNCSATDSTNYIVSASFTVTVQITLSSLTLDPSSANLVLGQNQQFTATGTFSDGTSRVLIGGDGTWVGKASMLSPRAGAVVDAVNGTLYAVGGTNDVYASLATMEAYDPAMDIWTSRTSMPTARSELAVGVVNGKLYVVGGYDGSNLATVEAYDPATDTWATMVPMSSPRAGAAVAELNGILYAVGGLDASYGNLATVEAYDPATNTWTPRASMSTARYSPDVGVVNGKLYVVGGGGGISGYGMPLATVEAYDPLTDTWTTLASMSTPRYAPGVGVVNGMLYAMGGVDSNWNSLATMEAYDPATNTWTPAPSMSTPRFVPGVAVVNGTLYAVGGVDPNGISIISTVEAYTPAGEVIWSSGDSTVATIDATGLASAVSPGSATITANYAGVSASASITVVTIPPVISVHDNLTVAAASTSGAIVSYILPTATDTVDGPVPVYCDWPSGVTFPIGITTVLCSATDSALNSANSSFTVTVVDAAPVLSVLGNLNVSATSTSGAIVTFPQMVTDTVDGTWLANCSTISGGIFSVPISLNSGDTFPIGTTPVNCSATDSANNTVSASFTVTVASTTSASLTLSGGVTAEVTAPVGEIFIVSPTVSTIVPVVSGVSFPNGTIDYTVTSPVGGNVTTMFVFTPVLAPNTVLYKVDSIGTATLIPTSSWTRTDTGTTTTIALTLLDGGAFDLDGVANGVVVDPLAVGVVLNQSPVASAGSDQNLYLGQSALLNGSASSDPDSDPLTYAWTLNAAPVGSLAVLFNANTMSPSLTPDVVGTYHLSLVVNDGTVDSAASPVLISVSLNLPPVAVATGTPILGDAPLPVVFSASTSSDPEGSTLTYAWDFGDPASGANNTSTLISPTHTYGTVGSYTAVVTATDNFGKTGQASVAVIVTAPNLPPNVLPTATPNNGAAPLNAQFAANASDVNAGDVLSYSWDFGDGSPLSTLANPQHSYSTGTFIATVSVSDGVNPLVSASLTISVNSALAIHVTEAKVERGEKGKVEGRISIKADFDYAGMPIVTDVIHVKLDGITLLEVPFGSFKQESESKYEYEAKTLKAEIDFNRGTIKVSRHKILTGDVDNTNGIDVEVSFGSATGTDHVDMRRDKGNGKLSSSGKDDHDSDLSHKR